jgi:hypothetical protein
MKNDRPESNSVDEVTPRTALELVGAIAAFARSLSEDEALVCSALIMAYQSVSADHLASRKLRR